MSGTPPSVGTPTAGTAARRPAAFGPLARLAVRGLLGRRRSLGVVLLAAVPVVVAVVLAIAGGLGDPETIAFEVFTSINLELVVPLAALILGTAVLGVLIDDGTIVYLLVKPVPRWTVVLSAMLVAAGSTAALTGIAALLAGLLLLGTAAPGLLAGMVAGALVASVLYVVVFVTLSVYTGRALVIGLGFVLVWEGLVTSLLTGTRILSIREYALAVVTALGGESATGSGRAGVDLPVAIVLSVVVLVVAFVLGARRLGQFEIGEAG